MNNLNIEFDFNTAYEGCDSQNYIEDINNNLYKIDGNKLYLVTSISHNYIGNISENDYNEIQNILNESSPF